MVHGLITQLTNHRPHRPPRPAIARQMRKKRLKIEGLKKWRACLGFSVTEPAGDVAQSLLVGNNGGKVKKKGRMNINCCLVQCPAIHLHFIFSLRNRLTVFSPQLSLQRLPKVPVPAANLSSSAFGVGDQHFCDLRQHYYSTSLYTAYASSRKSWAGFSETQIHRYDPKNPDRSVVYISRSSIR